jgi:hypothetical protein
MAISPAILHFGLGLSSPFSSSLFPTVSRTNPSPGLWSGVKEIAKQNFEYFVSGATIRGTGALVRGAPCANMLETPGPRILV